MKRVHAFEFGDQPWFPAILHETLTDALGFVGNLYPEIFLNFADLLEDAMERCNTTRLIDLGAGGGGPTPSLLKLLQVKRPSSTATLTDLYPNLSQFRRLAQKYRGLDFVEKSVDATQVASSLQGFRIISNAFHHFPPRLARSVLADAVRQRQGIAIFEMLERSFVHLLGLQSAPLLVLGLTPFIRPYRISRLVFTYLLPITPAIIWWDGLVSCLRIYSPEELRSLVDELHLEGVDADSYQWDIGRCSAYKLPGHFTYLIGVPRDI